MVRGTTLSRNIPTEDTLAAELRKQLDAAKFQPGDFVTTERDLARKEGVYREQVRRAVDQLIREGKLERRPGKGVYIRNPESSTRLVQIVMPNVGLWAETARGAKEAGLKAGIQTQIYDARGGFDADLDVLRNLPKTAAQGAIIVSAHHKRFAMALYELTLAQYPFVLVDETLRDIKVPSVVVDNYRGGHLVGQRLIDLGHHRIGFIGYFGADTVRHRLEGLRDAMGEARLHFNHKLVEQLRTDPGVDRSAEVVRAVQILLSRPDRPTAIFFFTDDVVPDGYRAIRDLGLRIPEDISIVGFDGLPVCRLLTPTLATVYQPAFEMGATAMEMLLDLMNDNRRHGSRALASRVSRSQANGATVAGDAPIAAAHKSPDDGDALHRVLPVTWQDGESVGPAPGTYHHEEHDDTKEEVLSTAAR